MKKLFLSFVVTMFATSMFAQDFIVKVCEDKIEKKTYHIPSESILVKSADEKDGFLLSLFFENKNGSVFCSGITIKSVVGSSCVEKSNLYIVLDNDEVITFTAWNKFNCDATSYFDLSGDQKKALSTHKIKTIRFKNGYDLASLTGIENGKESFFFRAFNNVVLKQINCN